MHRRSFIESVGRGLGLATVTTLLGPATLKRVEAQTRRVADLSPEEVAQDEFFWRDVQNAFSISRSLINLNNALLGASDVQLAVLRLCRNLVATARRVYLAGNPSVKADAAAAIFLAAGAGRAARFNVEANLAGLGWATEVGLAEAEADGGVRPEQVDELLNEAARLMLELEREERALENR